MLVFFRFVRHNVLLRHSSNSSVVILNVCAHSESSFLGEPNDDPTDELDHRMNHRCLDMARWHDRWKTTKTMTLPMMANADKSDDDVQKSWPTQMIENVPSPKWLYPWWPTRTRRATTMIFKIRDQLRLWKMCHRPIAAHYGGHGPEHISHKSQGNLASTKCWT